MARRFALIVVVAGLLAVLVYAAGYEPPTYEPPARDATRLDDRVGVITHVLGPREARKVVESGAGYVRLDVRWPEIEPQPGTFVFGVYDERMATARRHGLKVFATLVDVPAWAARGRGPNHPPADLAYWERFCAHVMARYRGQEIVWGIWNEPNMGAFLKDDSGRAYARLVEHAARARDTADPDARLAGPEMSHHALRTRDLARALDRVGARLDVVTVHWYHDGPDLDEYLRAVGRLVLPGTPIWLTEAGFGTCDDEEQTARIQPLLDAFHDPPVPNWEKLFLYHLYEPEWGCTYALVRPDWTNRPAFDWLRAQLRPGPR